MDPYKQQAVTWSLSLPTQTQVLQNSKLLLWSQFKKQNKWLDTNPNLQLQTNPFSSLQWLTPITTIEGPTLLRTNPFSSLQWFTLIATIEGPTSLRIMTSWKTMVCTFFDVYYPSWRKTAHKVWRSKLTYVIASVISLETMFRVPSLVRRAIDRSNWGNLYYPWYAQTWRPLATSSSIFPSHQTSEMTWVKWNSYTTAGASVCPSPEERYYTTLKWH